MGPEQQAAWQDEALDFVLQAIAQSPTLTELMVFRGARILYRHLGAPRRQSLDLDAVLRLQPTRETLGDAITEALTGAVEAEDPVRYDVTRVRVVPAPAVPHRRGWDGYRVDITLHDRRRPGVLGIPRLTVDLGAPERLGEHSVELLSIGSGTVQACTLENMTALKIRAFLQSSPDHRTRLGDGTRALRVKDLADLGRIWDVRHDAHDDFWRIVGTELRMACTDRLVICQGWQTFAVLEDEAAQQFARDPIVAATGDFAMTWQKVRRVIDRLEALGVFPIEAQTG